MKFKKLQTKNYVLENFKLSDVSTKYLDWLKDKKVNKYLTN